MEAWNLPPLDRTALPNPDLPGQWVPLEDLGRVADALKIERYDVKAVDIKSIPDAWAQIQLTSDALFRQAHEAHDDVKGQWRGLLALFALQPMYKSEYSLALDIIDIAPAQRAGGDRWRSRLHRILGELIPQSSVCNLTWERVAVINFVPTKQPKAAHKALGMLSPLTLIAPGRTSGLFSHSVPWLKDGLKDPLTIQGLRPEAWNILAKYLQNLLDVVQAPYQPGTQQVSDQEKLLGELKEYQALCAGRATAEVTLEPVQTGRDWPQDFYKALGSTYTAKLDTVSDCLIKTRPGDASELFAGIIVADPTIGSTLGRPAHEIRVWKDYTLLEIASPDSLATVQAEAEEEGYLVLTPDDFFTDQIIRMKKGTSIAAHGAAFRDKLLPLSPIALLCSTRQGSFADDVELQQLGDAIEVSFKLELPTSRGGNTPHHVRRRYEAQNVVEMLPPDDLAVWPDFEDPSWPWTFLRFQYDPTDDLQIRFGASAELVAGDVAEKPRERAQRLREWASGSELALERRLFRDDRMSMPVDGNGSPLLDRLRFIDKPRNVAEQHQLYRGVEAIFFSRRDGSKDVPVGCVGVSRRRIAPTEEAVVSVDFGTSNTIAYYRAGGRTPERILFKNRVLFPIEHDQDKSVVAAAYADFYPLETHHTPIPTVMKRRDFGGNLTPQLRRLVENVSQQNVTDSANETRSIHGLTHILFLMPRLGNTVSAEHLVGQIQSGLLQFEIKWDESSKASFIVSTYLRQLMIMVMAELADKGVRAGRVEWRLSYPQAFTHERASRFQEVAQTLIGRFQKETGQVDGAPAVFMTEGEAAATYFSEDETQKLQGVSPLLLMLDIGGGTTDMAIRCDRQLVWRGSIRLAGTDFFRQYLVNNIGILEAVDADSVRQFQSELADASKADREKALQQLVDLLIAKPSFADAFENQYQFHASELEWRGLRQCATVALGGMMHYLGLVLSELVHDGLVPENRINEISVALGGRGSTIFRRLAAPPLDQSELAKICSLVAVTAAGEPTDAHFLPHFSEGPKEEVARGLLIAANPGGRGPAQINRRLPTGLNAHVKKEGESLVVGSTEDVRALLTASAVERVDTEEFERFLSQLAHRTGLSIEIAGDAERTIRQNVQAYLGNSLAVVKAGATKRRRTELDEDTQTIEPLFVHALRTLVTLMSLPVAERDNRLNVRQRER